MSSTIETYLTEEGWNRRNLENGLIYYQDEQGDCWRNYNEYIQEQRNNKLEQLLNE
jgi:hypothetical protein